MCAVFSHTEQIGALRFVVAFLGFRLSFVGVEPELMLALDSFRYLPLALSVELLMYLNNRK